MLILKDFFYPLAGMLIAALLSIIARFFTSESLFSMNFIGPVSYGDSMLLIGLAIGFVIRAVKNKKAENVQKK